MDKNEKMLRIHKFFEEYHNLHEEYGRLWIDETFLHWDWWGSVFLAITPWVIRAFYRKKEGTHRLL